MFDGFGSILGFVGQQLTNDKNEDLFHEANEFSASQAQTNRDFQERMSNTAYQRAVKDMIAANLNPMLAYSQGGASTPSGNSASSVATPKIENTGVAAMNSAAALAQIANVKAQTKETEARTEGLYMDNELKDIRDPTQPWGTTRMTETRMRQETREIQNRADKLIEENKLTQAQANLVRENIKNARETNKAIQADTRDTTANAVLRELAEAEAKNKQTFQLRYPEYSIHRQFGTDAMDAAGTAAKLRRGK